jgi:putative transposase
LQEGAYGGARLRRGEGIDLRGKQRYSLTFSTFRRQAIFTNQGIVDVVLEQILRAACDADVAVMAYCFMPDHCHLLVRGLDETVSLPNFVKRAKQLSGCHGKHLAGCRIWQPGYYERTLRLADRTDDAIDYILNNPVRAGLTPTAADYPFSATFLPPYS